MTIYSNSVLSTRSSTDNCNTADTATILVSQWNPLAGWLRNSKNVVDAATAARAKQLEENVKQMDAQMAGEGDDSFLDIVTRCMELQTLMQCIAAVPADSKSKFFSLRQRAVKCRSEMEDCCCNMGLRQKTLIALVQSIQSRLGSLSSQATQGELLLG